MSNDTAPPVLPNPFTPLAFLDPESANSLEASRYLGVAAFGVIGHAPDCRKLQIVQGIFYIISTGCTSFLFLLCVVAVWNWNKWILATFILLWLATIGATITVPVDLRSSHIGNLPLNAIYPFLIVEANIPGELSGLLTDKEVVLCPSQMCQ
ncbi:hypothetical protein L218DRAFT_950967 [Marasmius fiardii PR-910]|nr:hypothetical protein L218DRAFT_950967 [Marasmius fiardii PR-910]